MSESVVAFCGDTPASNFLGGFKEGVGGAFRKCRRCMASVADIQSKVWQNALSIYSANGIETPATDSDVLLLNGIV